MSRPTTSEEIRSAFLQFFSEKKHEIVPSDSLVPKNDPTLMFTNAGMNQFKDVFLGTGERPYNRAVDSQKCLRVSGKHNDLEEVGYDTYHHTFFEMLGNWSFGDYFKKEAIQWGWELLVNRWGLTPDRLYATVHAGDEKLGLKADNEAAAFWKSETSLDPDHILFCDSTDNFWMMGDTGPCGPCSEVHIDLRSDEERAKIDGKSLVNADHPEVIEIWNLVFIQYNAQLDGSLKSLSAQHVDTGMGFERVVAVLQGKTSTYDTDLFAELLQKIADLSPIAEIDSYDGMANADAKLREKYRIAMRVIVDHIRTCVFAISDGASPGNAGQSYVIRRILRRAVRYGYQTLGLKNPFLFQLVDVVAGKMGGAFPEIIEQKDYIEKVIKAEEEGFLETLGLGLTFFDRLTPYVLKFKAGEMKLDALHADNQAIDLLEKAYVGKDRDAMLNQFAEIGATGKMSGEIAFLLHDTYGFPIDLTELMLREEGLALDKKQYEVLMQQQKERARAATSFKIDQSNVDQWEIVSEGEDSRFVGYDELTVEDARVRSVRSVASEETTFYQIRLDVTPFYAESGGQIGDTGTLVVGDEEIQVLDTRKDQDRIIHFVDRLPTSLDAPVLAQVDTARRHQIQKHHSATHLLHAALREYLGSHVTQKGSMVAPDRLRFDFSHFERMTAEQIRLVEDRVNGVIQRNISRKEERDVPIDDAMSRGATALFGEKYGDAVRVITFDPEYSIELCGGTHVDATGELGEFRLLSEGSVAAGVRRVEAVVGEAATQFVNDAIDELERVRGQFKALKVTPSEAVAELLKENKRLEKELAAQSQHQLEGQLDGFINQALEVGGNRLVTGRVDGVDMDVLRNLGQSLRDRLPEKSVAILGTVAPEGDKAYLVASVSDDLIKDHGVKAGAIVGSLAKKVGGGGGGKPQLATAGGRQPENLDDALASAAGILEAML
ncbi:MAG: alanine--tRNA ligase [Rhodothermales bacterium]